jgi:hypothetical protein
MADVEESPSLVPQWPLSSCLQSVVGRCRAEESLHAVDQGVFAGLLPPDCEVVDSAFSSDGQVLLKQLIIDNPFHIPPDAQRYLARNGVFLMSKLPCFKCANHFWALLSTMKYSP